MLRFKIKKELYPKYKTWSLASTLEEEKIAGYMAGVYACTRPP